MNATYNKLVEIFEQSNLKNHIENIKTELIDDGLGFRIWISDWVVFFNEFGTGVYNASGEGRSTPWVYFNEKYDNNKGGHFFTTNGMEPKYMFSTLEMLLMDTANEFYQIALKYTVNDQGYQSFKNSL